MKRTAYLFVVLLMFVTLLSGCMKTIDNMFESTNGLLDELIGKQDTKDSTVKKSTSEVGDSDATHNSEEIKTQGNYEAIDLPIAFPLTMPSDWQLVDVVYDEAAYWEGIFCFDLEMDDARNDFELLLDNEGYELTGDSIENKLKDSVYSTAFNYLGAYPLWQGDISYFIDEFGSCCSKLYLTLGDE